MPSDECTGNMCVAHRLFCECSAAGKWEHCEFYVHHTRSDKCLWRLDMGGGIVHCGSEEAQRDARIKDRMRKS